MPVLTDERPQAEPPERRTYRSAECTPACGCRDCPGAEGFLSYKEMIEHQHKLCVHQAHGFEQRYYSNF